MQFDISEISYMIGYKLSRQKGKESLKNIVLLKFFSGLTELGLGRYYRRPKSNLSVWGIGMVLKGKKSKHLNNS